MRLVVLLAFATVFASTASADGLRLDRPVTVDSPDLVLQYDDGSAYWLTWTGLYKGVWFNIDDFGQGLMWVAEQSQLWFYHHPSYSWDTSSFYCELYNGDQSGPVPVSLMDQTSMAAIHYQPVYTYHWPAPQCGPDFWIVVNSEMSSGGWPSLLSDGSTRPVAHSFHSDDFEVWEPWLSATQKCDYMIRSTGWQTALESATWGSIKAIF